MNEQPSSEIKVGHILCGGFPGTTVTPQAYHLIVDHNVSTIFLSRKNTVSVKQITKLIRDLQHIAYTQAHYKYPLMFAIDEEGGMMNSLFDPDHFTQFPGAMALSATGDTELVYEVLKALAVELTHIGFLIILGPVLDVVTKFSHQLVGVRSFGTTIEDVTRYGRACAKGLQDGGLFTFGKHFPGIGNATVDSLLELPMMYDSLEQIRQFNSVPFANLIKEGLLDGISAAGCGVPTISPDETHACLSPVIINNLLREYLGFEGVVISECLEMDALYHSIGLGQGVILSLYAGCDLVMVCHDKGLQDEVIESMKKALDNGNLDEEIILKCLKRIEKLQKRLRSWEEIFSYDGLDLDRSLYKEVFPESWNNHERLSQTAYRKSLTLVRDYSGVLPLPNYLDTNGSTEENASNNILLLTPLLHPVYPKEKGNRKGQNNTYSGEEVFQEFGHYLSNHPKNLNLKTPFNVLHTTYTANGLTALHESLIENSRTVIVLTSEASRNMYQIGIVKYVSILCGASPTSFTSSSSVTRSQLAKPLIIIATLSPYDFFYNRNIGSAYLCCYDYTDNVLKELAGLIMGDFPAEGCIPGEEKYIVKPNKRRASDQSSPESLSTLKLRKSTQPRRRWLVDEFDLNRDWASLVNVWKTNTEPINSLAETSSLHTMSEQLGQLSYQDDYFYKKLYFLLYTTNKTQKHFVVRNSSLNVIYGFVLTWVNDHHDVPLGENLNENDTTSLQKIGSILYLLVDKSKRFQSIGKNLHARALRYLVKEQNCTTITLGNSFPLIVLPRVLDLTELRNDKIISFINSIGWKPSFNKADKKYLMLLDDLPNWQVPKKIFRELMIVGVRFDICVNLESLMNLIDSHCKHNNKPDKDKRGFVSELSLHVSLTKDLYFEAIKYLNSKSHNAVKIITALEPTNQNVIGSIIIFTNKSPLSKFFPVFEESLKEEHIHLTDHTSPSSLVAGIVGPVIDPSYSNLTEIINFGLICSAITFIKTNFNDAENSMRRCVMFGVAADKSGSLDDMKEIGFREWKHYYDFYQRADATKTPFAEN